MSSLPPLSNAVIERLAKALGDKSDGLSGTETGRLLSDHRMEDPGAGLTKWKQFDIAPRMHFTTKRPLNGGRAFVNEVCGDIPNCALGSG